MKKIILIVLAIAAGAAYYIYTDPKLSREVKSQVKSGVSALNPDSQQTAPMYKWQDKQGQWHVSDQPPPAGVKYERIQYHRDTNVIPALVPEEKK